MKHYGQPNIDSCIWLIKFHFCRKNIVNEGSRRLSNFVDEIISSRRRGLTKSLWAGAGILDLLLSAVDPEGQPFTDEGIKDEAMEFVTAGHEITGTLLTWILYVLMTELSVLSACKVEVDKVLPDGAVPTHEDINKLAVCEAIVHETLRLYPPASSFARVCTREHVVESHQKTMNIS
jgi:cytochrome P450